MRTLEESLKEEEEAEEEEEETMEVVVNPSNLLVN